MKVQSKSAPILTDNAPAISPELGPASPAAPGGQKAQRGDTFGSATASHAPMVIPCLDTERSLKALVAQGFAVPRIELRIRDLWEIGTIREFSSQLTTPMASDSYAQRWIREFRAREIGSGGVAAMKSRVRLDAPTIWRWLSRAV